MNFFNVHFKGVGCYFDFNTQTMEGKKTIVSPQLVLL